MQYEAFPGISIALILETTDRTGYHANSVGAFLSDFVHQDGSAIRASRAGGKFSPGKSEKKSGSSKSPLHHRVRRSESA
jgi:hypothetical protein